MIDILLVSLVLQAVFQSFFIQVSHDRQKKKKKASEIGIQLMNFSGRNTFFFISTCKIMSLQIVKKY